MGLSSFLLLVQKKPSKEKDTTNANPKFSFYTGLALHGYENLRFAPFVDASPQKRKEVIFKKMEFEISEWNVDNKGELTLPLMGVRVAAGFPSPATDYMKE